MELHSLVSLAMSRDSFDELDQGSIIRPSIRETVDSLQWLETHGRGQLEALNRSFGDVSATSSSSRPMRCMICTLPFGTCEHDEAWLEQHEKEVMLKPFRNEMDREIDDLLDVLKYEPVDLTSLPPLEDVDLEHMQWLPLPEEAADAIGAEHVKLFIPDKRAWHTTTVIEDQFVLVFGGFRSKEDLPQPFAPTPSVGDMEHLSDLRVYDVHGKRWRGSKSKDGPAGRYGHCAAALSGQRLLIFGGRGEGNKIFNDLWVYYLEDDKWERMHSQAVNDQTRPCPRFHADCAVVRHFNELHEPYEVLYLFGGTNGVENFNDLWLAHIDDNRVDRSDSKAITWSRGVAVGPVPPARYGHRISYSAQHSSLYVTGGCGVSPQGEYHSNTADVQTNIYLMHLCNILQEKYKKESDLAVLSAVSLQQQLSSTSTWSQGNNKRDSVLSLLFREAAEIAGKLSLREEETRLAEQKLVEAYKLSQAQIYYASLRKHSNNSDANKVKGMEVFVLQLKEGGVEGGLVWQERRFPPYRGDIPRERMHHAMAIIGDFLFVMGGAEPTSLLLRHVDEERGEQGPFTPLEVYILDLKVTVWRHCKPTNSLAMRLDMLRAAERDVRRVEGEVEEERRRLLSFGLSQGERTRELEVGEALLGVVRWRREKLRQAMGGGVEGEEMISPFSRIGASLSPIRQRLFLIGGFPAPAPTPLSSAPNLFPSSLFPKASLSHNPYPSLSLPSGPSGPSAPHASALSSSSSYAANAFNGGLTGSRVEFRHRSMVLDVEVEGERARRREAEQASFLERERARIEGEEKMKSLVTAQEMKEVIIAERRNREREWKEMSKMDFLSSLPPLSRPPAVQLQHANRSTLWLRWGALGGDSRGALVGEEGVTYLLYVRGAYEQISRGGRVEVLPREREYQIPRSSDLGLGLGLGLAFWGEVGKRGGKKGGKGKGGGAKGGLGKGSGEGQEPRDMLWVFDDQHKRFGGRVLRVRGGGLFDVKYDDGALEERVSRHRIRVPPPLSSAASPHSPNHFQQKRERKEQEKRERVRSLLEEKFRTPLLHPDDLSLRSTGGLQGREGQTLPPRPHPLYELLREERREGDSPLSPAGSPEPPPASASSSALPPTVQVAPQWRLVYRGPELSYAATSLAADTALLSEPLLKVPVLVSLQTLGLDHPSYELSQLSAPALFFTLAEEETGAGAGAGGKGVGKRGEGREGESEGKATEGLQGLSKTKREIITARLSDQQVARIERRSYAYYSQGLGEEYL